MYDHSAIFYPISKMFCNFSLRLNMAKRRHFFCVLGPETEEKIKLAKKFALTCSFQKVIRTLTFRGRAKFDNSLYFKTLGIV